MSIISGVGSPSSVGPTSGGSFYGYQSLTGPFLMQVAPANPARRKITFHNPGVTAMFISQTTLQNTGSDVVYDPSDIDTGGIGGSFLLDANGGTLVVTGECQKPWQAYGNLEDQVYNLTVIDSTTG